MAGIHAALLAQAKKDFNSGAPPADPASHAANVGLLFREFADNIEAGRDQVVLMSYGPEIVEDPPEGAFVTRHATPWRVFAVVFYRHEAKPEGSQ